MKLVSLIIDRADSWSSNPVGNFQGKAKLVGDRGSMEISLSPGAISRLIKTIQQEVSVTARDNASQVARAVTNASEEGFLLEQDGVIKAID